MRYDLCGTPAMQCRVVPTIWSLSLLYSHSPSYPSKSADGLLTWEHPADSVSIILCCVYLQVYAGGCLFCDENECTVCESGKVYDSATKQVRHPE